MAVAEVIVTYRGLSCRSEAASGHQASLHLSPCSDERCSTQDSAGATDPSAAFEGYHVEQDAYAATNMGPACYVQEQNSTVTSDQNVSAAVNMNATRCVQNHNGSVASDQNASATTNTSATCYVQDYNSTVASDQNATTCYSHPAETTSAPVESCSSASNNTDRNECLEGPRQQYKHDQTCYNPQLGPGESGPGHLELGRTSSSNSGHLESLACVADVACSISEPNFSSSSCLRTPVTLVTYTSASNGVSSDSSGYCSPEQHQSPVAASGGEDVTVQRAFRDTCPEQPSTDGVVTGRKRATFRARVR